MKLNKSIVIAMLAGMVFFASCTNEKEPGRTFIPDMQYSTAVEVYDVAVGDSTTSARKPVEGTIARGQVAKYALPNSWDGYLASDSVLSPIESTDETIAEGKNLYNIYCAVCHGEELDGQGSLFTSGKFRQPPPSFKAANYINLSEGKMFHVITYGKGMMGSHASQLLAKERWKVVHYIKSVQAKELEN